MRSLRCIHLIMPVAYFRFSRNSVEQALYGISTELPEADIQCTFLPVSGEIGFLRKLLVESEKNSSSAGFVLFVSSAEIQRFFQDANVPAVVFGSVFPETSELPWIDRDQKDIGVLLARFIREEKHRRCAVLMREKWGFGDNLLMDGVHQEFSTIAGTVIRVRSVPAIEEIAVSTIKSLLSQAGAPTALICRSDKLAYAAVAAASELKLSVPKQLRIVVAESSTQFPCVVATVSQEEQGVIIGRMLKQLKSRGKAVPNNVLIPVTLQSMRVAMG